MVKRHHRLVCAVAYSGVGDQARSEEIAQEAFLIAWSKQGQLRDPELLRPWLCGIARNLARNARRTAGRELGDCGLEQVADRGPSPFEELANKEVRREVWRALGALPERQREAVVLFYRADRSMAEVAGALGVSTAAAKQLVSRGRKHLRAELEARTEKHLSDTAPSAAFAAALMVRFDARPSPTTEPGPPVGGPIAAQSSLLGSKLAALATATLGVALVIGGGWLAWGGGGEVAASPGAQPDSATPASVGRRRASPPRATNKDTSAEPWSAPRPFPRLPRVTPFFHHRGEAAVVWREVRRHLYEHMSEETAAAAMLSFEDLCAETSGVVADWTGSKSDQNLLADVLTEATAQLYDLHQTFDDEWKATTEALQPVIYACLYELPEEGIRDRMRVIMRGELEKFGVEYDD